MQLYMMQLKTRYKENNLPRMPGPSPGGILPAVPTPARVISNAMLAPPNTGGKKRPKCNIRSMGYMNCDM